MTFSLALYAGWLPLMSLVTLMVYAWDKRRARRGGRRVAEKTLHTLEFLGGWPGAWLAMRWLRHKSSKRSYRVGYWGVVLLHLLVVGVVGWLLWA